MHPIDKEIVLGRERSVYSAQSSESGVRIEVRADLDYYIVGCSKALASVSSAMNKARLSLSLLDAGYLDAVATGEHSRSAYIELLVENSIIRVQSIYDRVLILANRILNLGVSNESINHNLLVTNEHALKFGLEVKLKVVSKACNDYPAIRNKVVHHDRYSEEQLDQLSLLINADHLAKEADMEPLLNEDLLNVVIKGYFNSKKDGVDSILIS